MYNNCMGKEIEFKYLVKELPFNMENYKSSEIEQVYLDIPNADKDKTYRLRKMDNKLFYCEKGNGLVSRDEFEIEITKEKYNSLIQFAENNVIRKTRYFIPLGYDNLVAELDIYYDKLEGLKTVEVEFKEDYDLSSFVPPSWFGKDVTSEPKFKNANLAKIETISSLY